MRSTLAKANHLPYRIEGKVAAYRYGLIPDENAYKKNDEWVYDRDVGCIVYGTFIDELGIVLPNISTRHAYGSFYSERPGHTLRATALVH